MKQVVSYVGAAIVAALLFASPAAAQVSAGLNEVGGKGSFEFGKRSDDAESLSQFDFEGYYVRFVTDRLAIGPGVNIFKFEGEDASGAVNALVNYHFGDTSKKMIPFVEGSAGVFFSGADEKPKFFSVGPGVKYFVGEGGGAITATAFYRRIMADSGDTNEFAIALGVAIFFGR